MIYFLRRVFCAGRGIVIGTAFQVTPVPTFGIAVPVPVPKFRLLEPHQFQVTTDIRRI